MSYLVLKKWRNYEWRLYPENSNFEGQIVYKGHKLGIDSNTLFEALDVKMHNNNSFEILKYNLTDSEFSQKKTWIKTDKSKLIIGLQESWETALAKFSSINLNSKKVIVTKLFL